jgi:hypothetical protein
VASSDWYFEASSSGVSLLVSTVSDIVVLQILTAL